MLRTFTILAVSAALTAFSGYVHGLWTGRWEDSPELEQALLRLQNVPATIGGAHGEPQTLDTRSVKLAGFRGYLLRRYDNRHTGTTVSVLLGCGRPGPLSVHTPDVCYRGAGFRQAGPAEKYLVAGKPGAPPAEFWTAKFIRGEGPGATHLRIFWGWNRQGEWQAPNNPRLAFAGAPALYKLYVVSQVPDPTTESEEGIDNRFLLQLLPELHRALFAKL
jgi:hypothetical protein